MVLVKLFISGDSTLISRYLSLNPELARLSSPPNARQIHRGARRPTPAQREYTELGSDHRSTLGTRFVIGFRLITGCCL